MSRLGRILLLSALLAAAPAVSAQDEAVRIGLTPVFLDDQVGFLENWRVYLAAKVGRQVRFVQRGNYREITQMLREGRIDFAWVCGYPWVMNRDELRLLAVPVFRGKPTYQSYLIVPAGDVRARSLADVRGKVFAFSDPDSNSGYLYPVFALQEMGEQPGGFFARTFFAWAHRNVVESVALGLAQAGAVDGYVWEALHILHPELTRRTRVIAKSPEFGFPPLAARRSIPQEKFQAVQDALTGMASDAEGARLLRTLNLDGFMPGTPQLFDGIDRMARSVGHG